MNLESKYIYPFKSLRFYFFL